MRVTIEDDRFDSIQRELHEKARQALSDGALETQAEAQRLAPVDTGRLRASITTREAGPLSHEVYTNVNYAAYQEFGTRYQSGKSFMRPAYERTRQGIVRSAERVLETL